MVSFFRYNMKTVQVLFLESDEQKFLVIAFSAWNIKETSSSSG